MTDDLRIDRRAFLGRLTVTAGGTAVAALLGPSLLQAGEAMPAASPMTPPPGMPPALAAALREIGPRIDGAKTVPLYAPLHPREPWPGIEVRRDLAYGPHERHRLDVFLPQQETQASAAGTGRRRAAPPPPPRRPIVVFIHGGGFARGAKSAPDSPFYDNVGRWAAQQGLVGITINYRLAPQFPFPAGVEDLTRAVAWIRSNAAKFGGDPARVVLWGHSAGGAHAADYVVRARNPAIAGAILTSGIYALGDKVSVWKDYYGSDVALYRERESAPLLARTDVPLFVVYAELDPPEFIADSEALLRAREAAGKPVRSLKLPAHSHLSETYAVGTTDDSLAGPVLAFIQALSPAGAARK